MDHELHRGERATGYRRHQFQRRHRRRSLALRALRVLAVVLIAPAGPLLLAQWMAASPRFLLREIEVRGTERVSRAWVETTVAPFTGRHLLAVPLEAVEARLRQHPWVRGVDLQKELPGRLRVEIRERRPVALLRRPDALYFVDPEGIVIDRFDPAAGPADLVLLRPASDSADLASAVELLRDLRRLRPEWSHAVSEIEILGADDYRLYAAGVAFPLVVSRERLASGLENLLRYLPEIRRRYGDPAQVDLRFERQIVLQPIAGRTPSGGVDPATEKG